MRETLGMAIELLGRRDGQSIRKFLGDGCKEIVHGLANSCRVSLQRWMAFSS
jgi:hypothetical protein